MQTNKKRAPKKNTRNVLRVVTKDDSIDLSPVKRYNSEGKPYWLILWAGLSKPTLRLTTQ